MVGYIKLIVYWLIRKPALWCGQFVCPDEMNKALTKEQLFWKRIILDEESTFYYRDLLERQDRYFKEKEKAFFSNPMNTPNKKN